MSTPPRSQMTRRTVLGSMAGLGLFSLAPSGAAADRIADRVESGNIGADSYHPGHPRVVHVGEKLWNPVWVSPEFINDRDNLAPRVPNPSAEPENYDPDDFNWRVKDRPEGSSAEITYQSSLLDEQPRWDAGKDNVGEFEADVAGNYTIELEAPDGTHEWTLYAFPEASGATGGPPRLELDATVDDSSFTIETNGALAPNSRQSPQDLEAHFFADDRDALETADIDVDGLSAVVETAALSDESARVHAVVYDGDQASVIDTIELHPDGTFALPNRAPEWMENGVMYQIFTRSWAGRRGETTFETLMNGDEIARGVSYLDELGVDVVWLTPIHPAVSPERELAGGGPHGYDITDYFDIAPDLVPDGMDSLEAYEQFIEVCHEHDIKVCLDVVVNHCGRWMDEFQTTIERQTSAPEFWPIVEEWDTESTYFDWFDRLDAPFEHDGEPLEVAPRVTGFWDLQLHPNFNFENVAVREYMLAFADFWSGEIGVDGFRCDIAWGVPHSFWKEMREVVRANNSEFLLLDEAIPNDRAFSENEFDMHFDTEGFTVPCHAIARGEADIVELFDAVRDRQNQGFPDYSLFLNAIENHDEHRTLNEALDGTRGDPKKAQRAVWAAGVALPGVPFVYYGQERAISVYGDGRHMGDDDTRDEGDVNPGGKQRAFMNWEEYDEEQVAFYKSVISAYHELDVLKPTAELSGAWHNSFGDVLVFGRDASGLDDVSGPERVVVLVNPNPGAAQVFLRPGVEGTDLITGEDISQDTPSNATEVAVNTIAVLETSDLLEIGADVSVFDVETGTDYGPGSYVYPENEAYTAGALDIEEFTIHETPQEYQFRLLIEGDVENPWELPEGFSVQHLQVYLHDPAEDSGTTTLRDGVNATGEAPHQYRVVVDGAHGSRLEDYNGNELTAGTVRVNEVTGGIIAALPKASLDRPIESYSVAPILLGYDPDETGNVARVTAEPSDTTFGGGVDDDTNPNIIDIVTDATEERSDALSYESETQAEISYIPLETPFEHVETIDVETGKPYGPGTYAVPTGSDYYDGAWDISELTINESRDDVQFEFTFAEPIQNPWNFDPGFSHPFFQLYIHNPDTDDEGTTSGRSGTHIETEVPYHTRVVVHGEGTMGVEAADGSGVTRDVSAETDDETVTITVPRRAIGWDLDEGGIAVAATVMPYDGFGEGGIRPIGADADEHTIGGGQSDLRDPAVMDMVTPEGVDRTAVLSDYDSDTRPAIAFVTFGELQREEIVEHDTESADDGDSQDDEDEQRDTSDADEADETTQTDDGIPGFGIGTGAAAIGGGALAAKRLADRNAGSDEVSKNE